MSLLRAPFVRWLAATLTLYALLVWPFPGQSASLAAALARPGVDVFLLFALACASAGVVAPARWHAWALAILTVLVSAYRFGDYFMTTFWGKPFEPYVDLRDFDALFHLLIHERSLLMQVVILVAMALGFVLVLVGLARLWRASIAGLRARRFAWVALFVLEAALLVAWCVNDHGKELRRGARAVLAKSTVGAAIEHVAGVLSSGSYQIGRIVDERMRLAALRIGGMPREFRTLAGVSVYVLFLESYGRQLASRDALRERYTALLRSIEGEFEGTPWRARSSWLRPSVCGGGSAFAHLELVTGIEVENRLIFDELLAREIVTLPSLMRAAGHRTYNIEPAMPREWPEAAVLGFERELFRSFFPYEAHKYHWGDMPDQYALAYAWKEALRVEEAPVFAQFVSVTGHAPFSRIPPYLDDWSKAAEQSSFAGEPAQSFPIHWGNYATHPGLLDAYFASVEYGVRTAAGFARQLREPSIVIILGDHQPPFRQESADSSREYDVPIHVLTNAPRLHEAIEAWGYQEGWTPNSEAPSRPATEFLPMFLRSFGR